MVMNTNADEGKIEAAQNLQQTIQDTRSSFGSRCVACYKRLLAQIEEVKAAVVSEFRGRLETDQRVLELAVNEAEALAWETGFPQLLFPDLAAEKAHAVAGWHERQQALRRRSEPRLIAA
jgi:hypothetical protein